MSDTERRAGVVATCHLSPGKYGGSYGVILDDAGQDYVWNSSHVYRNFSRMSVGAKVTFDACRFDRYATAIDQTDKHSPIPTRREGR